MKNERKWIYVSIIIAGLCLCRVTWVSAGEDVDETYSAMESGAADSNADPDSKPEIRLLSPEDAAKDVADSDGVELVPGADRLKRNDNELIVPRKIDRKVAQDATSSEYQAQSVAASRGLAAEPMEPMRSAEAPSPTAGAASSLETEHAPMTEAQNRQQAADFHPDTIVAANKPPSDGTFGLKGEGATNTRIDPPVPESSGHVGVQEISLIVSDYGFFPSRIFVTQGIPVKLYLSTPSKTELCFLQDNWGIRKGVTPGKVEEVSFLPRDSGDFRFHCPIKSIQGMITVKEPAAAMPPSLRGLAAEPEKPTAGVGNEPKNAQSLRMLIED